MIRKLGFFITNPDDIIAVKIEVCLPGKTMKRRENGEENRE